MKWTVGQYKNIRSIALQKELPTIEDVKGHYPKFSERKATRMLEKIKDLRKEIVDKFNVTDVCGIRNSKGEGFIYLVTHELYVGWVKCGMTTNTRKRLIQYNCNDPMKRFKFISAKNVADRIKSEKLLIYNLKQISTINCGEWFKVDENRAVNIFNSI